MIILAIAHLELTELFDLGEVIYFHIHLAYVVPQNVVGAAPKPYNGRKSPGLK